MKTNFRHSQKHIYKIIVCIPICSPFPPITPDGQFTVLRPTPLSMDHIPPSLILPSHYS